MFSASTPTCALVKKEMHVLWNFIPDPILRRYNSTADKSLILTRQKRKISPADSH